MMGVDVGNVMGRTTPGSDFHFRGVRQHSFDGIDYTVSYLSTLCPYGCSVFENDL